MKKIILNEEVKFTVNTKELNGILTHPASDVPHPAIVLLHGSDRSGMKNPYYTEHAENLVRSGFAVLRYDGPGWAGGSSGNSGFETLEYRMEEAIAAVKYLQSRPDIKSNAVVLWGVSQGGWICQMAAASYDGVAFIIPVRVHRRQPLHGPGPEGDGPLGRGDGQRPEVLQRQPAHH